MKESIEERYKKHVASVERNDRLEKLAQKHGGRVVWDKSSNKPQIHIHSFCYVTEDGTVIHETP